MYRPFRLLWGITTFSFLFLVSAHAATQDFSRLSADSFLSYGNALEETSANNAGLHLSIDAAVLSASFKPAAALELTDFPLSPVESGTLRLQRVRSVIDANTEIWVGDDENGRRLPVPSIQSFRGEIVGEQGSFVFLSAVDGTLIGNIQRADGSNHIFAPIGQHGKHRDAHLLASEAQAVPNATEIDFNCLSDFGDWGEGSVESKDFQRDRTQAQDDETLLELELAVETDTQFYSLMNNDIERQLEYITAVYAMISNIYEEYVNVTFYINRLFLWEEAPNEDPYRDDGNIGIMLGEMQSYWNQRRKGVQRDIAQLVTATGSTQVGGIAFPGQPGSGSLCDKSFGYSVIGFRGRFSYPTLGYTWDVIAAAHELGHNFGSPHTHSCYWKPALDSCVLNRSGGDRNIDCIGDRPVNAPGSIMSYCHLLNGQVQIRFLEEVADLIRQGANSKSDRCIDEVTEPSIFVQHPLGAGQAYAAGTPVDVAWTSSRVSTVGLKYSTNYGDSWNEIVSGIDAVDRAYTWQIPKDFGNHEQVKLMVYDVRDPAVFDSTWGAFAVEASEVKVTHPNGSEILVEGRTVKLTWDSRLVEAVDIYYSVNNGRTWREIVRNTANNSNYNWAVPQGIHTEDALIRVVDASNGETLDESDARFEIAAPRLRPILPGWRDGVLIGSSYQIQWEAEHVDKVRLALVIGDDTTTIRFSTDAVKGQFDWNVDPNQYSETSEAYILITGIGFSFRVYTLAGPFALVTNPVLSVGDQTAPVPMRLLSIAPNPAASHTSVAYSSDVLTEWVEIRVQDVLGRELLRERSVGTLLPGRHQIEVATEGLATGLYVISIESTAGRASGTLSIAR